MRFALYATILIAMGAAGLRVGSAYRWREKLLSRLVQEMQRLEEQVRVGRPLQLALGQGDMPLFSRMAEFVGTCSAEEAWRKVCETAPASERLDAMESPERRLMEQFWAELGTLDRRSQLDRFAETTRQLVLLRDQSSAEAVQRSRLYGSLGILLGLMIVVLLW